jgi:D-alanine-D-alanine ligase
MRVIVLLGGDSTEREVSHVTGRAVAAALKRRGHDVLAVDTAGGRLIDFDGSSHINTLPPERALAPADQMLSTVARIGAQAFGEVDVVFVALHGTGGEDGTVQALLELAGIAYTGSGIMASSLAMDKEMSKRVFRDLGVPTPPGFVADVNPPRDDLPDRVAAECGYPAVVKPNAQGSSVGVTIVRDPSGLAEAVARAAEYDARVVFERFIAGRELTVGILADRALPVVEIVPKQGFYNYTSKYTPGNTTYVVPAPIPDAVARRVQELALRCFHGLRCRDFSRVDFRLSEADEPYCLEINTIPGMTPTSLVPKAAKAAGIEFDALIERIVQSAALRASVRSR